MQKTKIKHPHHLSLLICLAAGIALLSSGCAVQSPGSQSQPGHADNKTAVNHMAMADMEPGFLFLASQNALKEGQPELAIKLLEALVQKDASAIQPHFQLVQLLLEQNQFKKAGSHIQSLNESEKLTPEQRKQVELMQARLSFGLGKADAALKQLDRFLSRHPNSTPALELKIQILNQQKKPDEAIRVIKHAIRLQDTPRLRLLQAQLLLQQKQETGAKLALLRMKDLAPDDDIPILMLSQLAQQEKKLDEAENYLRDFLEEHPDALRISNALGRMLVKENRLVEAILIYREIDAKTGGEPSVLQALGLLYYQHKDFNQAIETFRKLIALQASDEASFYLANSLEATKHYKQARSIYDSIAAGSSPYNEAQLRLAGLDAMDNAPEKAARRLKQIIQKHPDQLIAYAMLSSIRIAQKEYQKALDETDNTLAISKLPPQLLFNRAVAFDHFKNYAQVESMLKRIIEHDSKHSDALNFLGYTYAVQGIRLDEAESLIQRALTQKPDDGYYLDSLAWAQYKKGQFKKAITTQKNALEKIKDDPVMHEHMGDMLWANNQQEEARKQWQQAIKLKHESPKMLRRKIDRGLP